MPSLPRLVDELDGVAFQRWYGRWQPMSPPRVAALLDGAQVGWYVAGGRAARVGAPSRHHEDTDVVVRLGDLPALRSHLQPGWHLWEAHDGSLRPLLPGDDLRPGRQQLWIRRDADSPWELDLLLEAVEEEWVFTRDPGVRLAWDQALHTVGGVRYLRPEVALLHKAHLDREKDRADLQVANLTPEARDWLARTLARLGHHGWAELVRVPVPVEPARGAAAPALPSADEQ